MSLQRTLGFALTTPLLLLAGCAGPEPTQDEAAAPPESAAELIDQSLNARRSRVHTFRLVETRGDEPVREGHLTVFPEQTRPLFDLAWSGDAEARITSDGTSVFVKNATGDVSASAWSEAGSVLYSEAAGRLVSAAIDPSSFLAYGASLVPAPSPGILRVEVGLPTGGGWQLDVSGETLLPTTVGFRAEAESELELLRLEPVATDPSARAAALEPEAGRSLLPYFAGPQPGDAAPDIEFELVDGSRVRLVDLRGSVVVLDFWATWCGPCRPAMRALEELYQAHRDEGLAVYGLRLFDGGDASAFLEELGVTYPIGDGAPFAEPYAVATYGLPTLYLIDREGAVAKLIVGFSDESEGALIEAVEEALAGPEST